MLFEHKWLYSSLFMKIVAFLFVFSLLTTAKLSAAPMVPDSVEKAFLAASDSLKAAQSNPVVLSYNFGQQSSANGSLRTAENIQSPAMIAPAGITPELRARYDSVKTARQLQMRSDSSKAAEYAQKAGEYLHYDTISNKKEKLAAENEAIAYTLKAIHYYSRCDDTTGLRTSFDILAKVYRSEKKYVQAKWFILQSNTLSRVKNDVPNIITSLLLLASIKTDIKDYNLAMGDLNEAMRLADSSHEPKTAAMVQLGYVMLYNNMKNYSKADIALKRYNFINDSIQHGTDAKLAAAADSVQHKKKLYLTSSKRSSKTSSSKKIALL
jgi:hypothetical protein